MKAANLMETLNHIVPRELPFPLPQRTESRQKISMSGIGPRQPGAFGLRLLHSSGVAGQVSGVRARALRTYPDTPDRLSDFECDDDPLMLTSLLSWIPSELLKCSLYDIKGLLQNFDTYDLPEGKTEDLTMTEKMMIRENETSWEYLQTEEENICRHANHHQRSDRESQPTGYVGYRRGNGHPIIRDIGSFMEFGDPEDDFQGTQSVGEEQSRFP
jgi:hypothetical protein